jgi:hypothetical protein
LVLSWKKIWQKGLKNQQVCELTRASAAYASYVIAIFQTWSLFGKKLKIWQKILKKSRGFN